MEKSAARRSFSWIIVLILPFLLILGVMPCAAEETYTLQELIEGDPIYIDNLTFSGFKLDAEPLALPTSENTPQPSDITVEKVGQGTSSPGLKFTPNFQVAVQPGSSTAPFFLKTVSFSYQVNDGSGLIEGSVLILNPGTVEATGAYAKARVEDRGDPLNSTDYLAVMRDNHELDSSGEYIVEDTLQQKIKFSPRETVSPRINVALTVSAPGGEASIQSFEHKVSLLPAPGGPVANAGPDLVVFDQVSLDGSGSSPTDAEYQWELYKIDGGSLTLVGGPEPQVQATFTDLAYGFYEARLKVTNGGVSAVDCANIYAAGPAGTGTEPKAEENAELNLWHFKLKKYKYCRWSVARMLGTFDLPDDFEFNRGDDLVGKVTIQLNRGDEPPVVMSDEVKLKVKNWKYKSLIQNY